MVPITTFIKWEVIYVGNSQSADFDQTLASVNVGPIEVGINRFVLRAEPPKKENITPEDFNLTAIMVKAYYNDNEFIRIGYYVHNITPEGIDNPPGDQIEREILVEDMTIHQRQIKW